MRAALLVRLLTCPLVGALLAPVPELGRDAARAERIGRASARERAIAVWLRLLAAGGARGAVLDSAGVVPFRLTGDSVASGALRRWTAEGRDVLFGSPEELSCGAGADVAVCNTVPVGGLSVPEVGGAR